MDRSLVKWCRGKYIRKYLIEHLSTTEQTHVIDRKVMNYQNLKIERVEML